MARLVLADETIIPINNYTSTGIVFDRTPADALEIHNLMTDMDLEGATVIRDHDDIVLATIENLTYSGQLIVNSSTITACLEQKIWAVTAEEKRYIDAGKILLGEEV